MRILFHNRTDTTEAAERKSIEHKIDAWWHAFRKKQRDIIQLFQNQANWDLHGWMEENLQCISPHLMYEFGPPVRCDGHRLVITPESEVHLRPLVSLILERAPILPNWEFYPYRLPEDVEQAELAVKGRTGGSIQDLTVRPSIEEGGRVSLRYFSPRCRSVEDQQAFSEAFVATETLLGEEILDKWVGPIEIAPKPKPKRFLGLFRNESQKEPNLIPLDRLKPTVDSLIASVLEQLPPGPVHTFVDSLKWSGVKANPQTSPDYEGQTDLFVATTPLLRTWQAAHSRGFYSERYSRCGETFCYVKLDGAEGLENSRFDDRAQIEDALDAALRPSGLGCAIGGGTGLRYSYVDLALTNAQPGIDVVRTVLSEGNVPKRSWVLFYDVVLAQEWVGVFDDSPPPPMEDRV